MNISTNNRTIFLPFDQIRKSPPGADAAVCMKVTSSAGRMDGRRSDTRRCGAVQSPLKRRSATKKFDLREKLNRCNSSLEQQVSLVEPKFPKEMETDPIVLDRRSKEIQYGKNTQDYVKYRNQTPKEYRLASMPKTPDKYQKISRRRWDGIIKSWKLKIHREVVSMPKMDSDITSSRVYQYPKIAVGDWSKEVELEESQELRSRVSSCTSSDVGFCSSGVVTPRTISGSQSPEDDAIEKLVATEYSDQTPIDYIDYIDY